MPRSFLIGLVGRMRSLTALAAVGDAARRGALPADNGAPAFLVTPDVAAGTMALAAGEVLGDKLPSAPDRIIALGMAARLVPGAVAGAALAPRDDRAVAAALGPRARWAAYLTFDARMAATCRRSLMTTGLVEDAFVIAAALRIVDGMSSPGR